MTNVFLTTIIDLMSTWYIVVGNVVACGLFLTDFHYLAFSPRYLHRNTRMNWFECLISSGVIIAIFPLYCIIATIIWFVWFIFHVGRKSESDDKNKKEEN